MKFLAIAPALPSLDMQASIAFYRDVLGCTIQTYQDDSYAVVSRNGMALHLWTCSDPDIPAASGCWITIDDAQHLYEACAKAGVIHPRAHIEAKPYGMLEFGVLDPSGNLIRFGQQIAEIW